MPTNPFKNRMLARYDFWRHPQTQINMIGFSKGKLIIVVEVIEGYEFLEGLQKSLARTIALSNELPDDYRGYLSNLLESLAINHRQSEAIAEMPQSDLFNAIFGTSPRNDT